MSEIANLEATFFRTVNAVVEPMARAGWGSPGVTPTGLVVLETTGRRSGLARRTPVFATVAGDYVVVGTARGTRSQWIKNARSNPAVRYWLCGQEHDARAIVFAPGAWPEGARDLPPLMQSIATSLFAATSAAGAAFAVLILTEHGPAQSEPYLVVPDGDEP